MLAAVIIIHPTVSAFPEAQTEHAATTQTHNATNAQTTNTDATQTKQNGIYASTLAGLKTEHALQDKHANT